MAHSVNSSNMMEEVCEIFHIDPDRVRKIVITLEVNDVARIEVTKFMTEEQVPFLNKVLQKHELKKK